MSWTKIWEWVKSFFVKTAPKPEPEKPAADEWTTAVMHTTQSEVRDWPIVSSLSVEIRGGRLYCQTDKPELWPNIDGTIGNICVLLWRKNAWHAGPCDGMRPFQQNGGDRGLGCVCVPDGDTRTYEPESGERVGIVITGHCRDRRKMKPKQRTSVGWIVWP